MFGGKRRVFVVSFFGLVAAGSFRVRVFVGLVIGRIRRRVLSFVGLCFGEFLWRDVGDSLAGGDVSAGRWVFKFVYGFRAV